MTDDIRPNPELYARMAEPYPTQEEAQEAVSRFLEAVARAREECRVPEVLVIAAARFSPVKPGDETLTGQSLAMGSSGVHPGMAATLFNQHAAPVIEHARRLETAATRKAKR